MPRKTILIFSLFTFTLLAVIYGVCPITAFSSERLAPNEAGNAIDGSNRPTQGRGIGPAA